MINNFKGGNKIVFLCKIFTALHSVYVRGVHLMQREDIFFKKGGNKIASLGNGLCPSKNVHVRGINIL